MARERLRVQGVVVERSDPLVLLSEPRFSAGPLPEPSPPLGFPGLAVGPGYPEQREPQGTDMERPRGMAPVLFGHAQLQSRAHSTLERTRSEASRHARQSLQLQTKWVMAQMPPHDHQQHSRPPPQPETPKATMPLQPPPSGVRGQRAEPLRHSAPEPKSAPIGQQL
ncbi:unannotated protein [freshwater metagenome]|uniref:Unannotated protein n=1 Tax=freshwater metagenome TaxID=449393 RepID=A0A6J6T871_9ZZZZ